MEKSPDNFRDNLAKTLKSIPDHGARRQVSETLKNTPAYEAAKETRDYWRDRGDALHEEILELDRKSVV